MSLACQKHERLNRVRASYLQFPVYAGLKDNTRLHLKHPRRIDVSERRNRVGSCAHAANKLSERGSGSYCVAIDGHASTEHVCVIEDVEAFDAQNNVTALALEQVLLDKKGNVRSR